MDFPELKGGSREVTSVRSTFGKLHRLLRAANSAFFTGDLPKAYETLHDALVLFTKLQNKKAIGIASNNLGNVMLAMYRTMKKTGAPSIACLSDKETIDRGRRYFRRSINAGEEALERINNEEGWSEKYLIFMQQLSNRYFNRAMFLLTVRDDHPYPSEAENQGLTDLSTCKDMDREVVDNGQTVGFKGDEDVYFELLLSRIKGLLSLMRMGYEDVWGIEELFEDAKTVLSTALQCPDHTLFRDLEAAGQMQRLDSALIEYYLLLASKAKNGGGDEVVEKRAEEQEYVKKAAAIATRMLFDDDYVIGEAGLLALKALLDWTSMCSAEDFAGDDPSDVRSSLFHYRHQVCETLALSQSWADMLSRESFAAARMGDFSMESF